MLASLPPSLEKLDVVLMPPIKVATQNMLCPPRCALTSVTKSFASNVVDAIDCNTMTHHSPFMSGRAAFGVQITLVQVL